tara:strand:- start:416 stop:721 length:306 start_codon:yes stop_codon:yes gene_type:complete
MSTGVPKLTQHAQFFVVGTPRHNAIEEVVLVHYTNDGSILTQRCEQAPYLNTAYPLSQKTMCLEDWMIGDFEKHRVFSEHTAAAAYVIKQRRKQTYLTSGR